MHTSNLRLPFVVTIATASACGGTTIIDVDSATGGSSTSTSGTAGSGGQTTSTSSGNTLTCPDEPPSNAFQPCAEPPGTCSYDVACQSGVVNLSFTCEQGDWAMVPKACDEPYDSCPLMGLDSFFCGASWGFGVSNPPAPCPGSLPPEGQPCGDNPGKCGYRCGPEPNAAWTVATCVGVYPNGTWQLDGACN